eukprot:11124863-Alexandrium_andersonii.AAC.1
MFRPCCDRQCATPAVTPGRSTRAQSVGPPSMRHSQGPQHRRAIPSTQPELSCTTARPSDGQNNN